MLIKLFDNEPCSFTYMKKNSPKKTPGKHTSGLPFSRYSLDCCFSALFSRIIFFADFVAFARNSFLWKIWNPWWNVGRKARSDFVFAGREMPGKALAGLPGRENIFMLRLQKISYCIHGIRGFSTIPCDKHSPQ